MKRKFDRDEQIEKTRRRTVHRKSRLMKHIKSGESGIVKTRLMCGHTGRYKKIAPAVLSLLLAAALITSAVLPAADADGAENAASQEIAVSESAADEEVSAADTASSGSGDADTVSDAAQTANGTSAIESDGGGSGADIRHGHRL